MKMLEEKDFTEDKALMMAQSAEQLWLELNNYKCLAKSSMVDDQKTPHPFFVTSKGEDMELVWNHVTNASYLLNNSTKQAWTLRAWDKTIPIFTKCSIDKDSFLMHGININFDIDGFLDWWGFYIDVYEAGLVTILWMINNVCIMTFMDKYANVLLPLEAVSEEDRTNWIYNNRIKALNNLRRNEQA